MGIVALPQPAPLPARRLATPRLIATLALFALSATLFCTLVGYALVHRADDRHDNERRAALISAVEDVRTSAADFSRVDPVLIRTLERTTGLRNLRFDAEPSSGREIQSVLDRQGRIVGWFSWEPDRSMARAMRELQPLLALTGACLLAFAGIALWQVRRTIRALGRSERQAWSLAHEDMLTKLPNHRKLIDLMDAALAARSADDVVTLAFIDLDGLADINDAHGHAAGDQLLVDFAKRLADALPSGALYGRFDGDEFAAILTTRAAEEAEAAIRVASSELGRPFWINEQALQIGVTTGAAHVPLHATNRDELTRRADLALRAAKRKQRGGVAIFDPAMDVEFNERRFIERALRRALADNVVEVHYQPIVSADGERIVGAEALARWQHPARGAIPPAEFIPVAEQGGLMGRLGELVLRRALSDAARWPGLSIAVNLSPVQVRDSGIVELVAELLAASGIEPGRLILEVTEGVLLDNPDEAQARLDALRALGVRLAIDDFGTGYSSLAYLQRFRFDKLKIDKAFVTPLDRSGGGQAMIQAIVSLGRALDLALLAEGVETEEQRVMLRLAGCDEMQGFLFARPGPPEALDRLLAENGSLAPALVAAG